jgi:hypothetical protein
MRRLDDRQPFFLGNRAPVQRLILQTGCSVGSVDRSSWAQFDNLSVKPNRLRDVGRMLAEAGVVIVSGSELPERDTAHRGDQGHRTETP